MQNTRNMGYKLIGFVLTLLPLGCVLGGDLPYRLLIPRKELAECKQMILVLTPRWKSISGRIQLFERSATGRWMMVRWNFPCVVGRSGLGWGIGLHGTGAGGDPHKREGDGRAPAGIFQLNTCMGVASAKQALVIHFPYRQITTATEAVYDPRSLYYNRVVDRDAVDRVDWSAAEQMLRPDGLYRWIVVVEHNWKPDAGFGSCIFLHLWQGRRIPTIGCTATGPEDLEFLVHWLDAKKHPLLVQLPEAVYLSLKPKWELP